MDRRPRFKVVCPECGESLLYRRWGHDLVCKARRKSLLKEDQERALSQPRGIERAWRVLRKS